MTSNPQRKEGRFAIGCCSNQELCVRLGLGSGLLLTDWVSHFNDLKMGDLAVPENTVAQNTCHGRRWDHAVYKTLPGLEKPLGNRTRGM